MIPTIDNETKKVIDYLNEINYSIDPKYVPNAFALGFVNFIKLVNGGAGEENKTPVLHFKMLDQVGSGERAILNMIHRGAAKTTVFGEYLFLYLATFGEIPNFGAVEFALYVSDSIDNGVKNMRKNLQFRWENSEFLQKMVPKTNFTDIEWQFTNADGKKFVVKGYGAKTGVRGAKSMGKRPQLAILDDLVSDEDARSATVIASIDDTVYKAVDYALHPTKRMIIWSGTPFNMRDPLYKAVESGAWAVNVYPVCEKFPCTRAEFKGSWPDRFDYDYVLAMYTKAVKSGKVHTFNQELMLRIMSDEDRLILDEDIQWYTRSTLLKNRSSFNFYITTDFATSEKESADFSVISVWAINSGGRIFWVDGVIQRQTMDKNIDDLFKMVQIYKPQSVGIEVSGQQGGFIPWIQREMVTRNVFFNLASDSNNNNPGIKPTTNKMERFNVVVPWFKIKLVFFPVEFKADPRIREIKTELELASPAGFKSMHDDFIDTVSMLGVINMWKPSDEFEMAPDGDSGIWGDEKEESSYRIGSYIC